VAGPVAVSVTAATSTPVWRRWRGCSPRCWHRSDVRRP
jgi:hypothetical protein